MVVVHAYFPATIDAIVERNGVTAFADESALKPRVSWLLNAAVVCRILGENSRAENFVAKATRIAPQNSAVIYHSAVDANQKGDGKKAVELAQALKKQGDVPNASIFLSQLLWQSDRKVVSVHHHHVDFDPTWG